MNRKAFLAALLTAAIGGLLLWVYLRRFEAETSGGARVPVLVATQDIPLGAALTEKMIGVREIPQAYVEGRHIRASSARQVLGVRVSMGVKANEALLWTDLAVTSEQRRDLSGLVKAGMRAVTIRADATSTFGGLVRPGDRVDVLLTSAQPTAEPVTLPLLQNALVLAVGRDTGSFGPDDRRRPASPLSQITLSVTLEQAQVLALAAEKGHLSLALRNPDDITVLDGLPATTAGDIFQQTRREEIQRHDRPATPHNPAGNSGIEHVQ